MGGADLRPFTSDLLEPPEQELSEAMASQSARSKQAGQISATAVEMLGIYDLSYAAVYAPDVYPLAARLSTIEDKIAAGLPFSTPVLPFYAVANLPKSSNVGRKAFARDGRAPNAAGVLDAANAGTGVEVVDNGTKWVISGTNQAVQA